MCEIEGNNLKRLLTEFYQKILEIIDNSRNKIEPSFELFFRWKVTRFKYTEEGVTEYGAIRENFTKLNWSIAIEDYLMKEIVKTTEHRKISKYLNDIPKSKDDTPYLNLGNCLNLFIHNLISQVLIEEVDLDAPNRLIETFQKHVKREPLKYEVKIELDGLTLYPLKKFEFSVNNIKYTLRQTMINDLEKEYRAGGLESIRNSKPSSILHLEFLGDETLVIDTPRIDSLVKQAIYILRFFKVGSIKHISHQIHSESLYHAPTTSRPYDQLKKTFTIAQINEEDTRRLEAFWKKILTNLPKKMYGLRDHEIKHVLIAFQRYSDAITRDLILEGRITFVIMGLEALFLTDFVELSFRLKMRISKVLSIFNKDPISLKELITDAYHIRNRYVHGNLLTINDRKQLMKKYEDIEKDILLPVLEILRISLVLMIFIDSKDGFIRQIDDALIDKKQEKELENVLNNKIPSFLIK